MTDTSGASGPQADPSVWSADAKHEPGQVPCSIYRKSSSNLFGKSPRLGEWGCFGTPLGEWTTLSLVIERKTSKEFRTEMTMNGVKRSVQTLRVELFQMTSQNQVLWPIFVRREARDKLKDSKDPTIVSQVDAIAIGYPNGRHYDYIELAAA